MKKLAAEFGPVILSAIMLSLAFPPANIFLLVFLALVPWLRQLRDSESAWHAAKRGYLFGFLYFGFQMFWIFPFVFRWTGNFTLALVPWIISAFLAGFFFMLLGWLLNRTFARGWWWAVPLVWAGIEGFRAYVPTLAFPWGNVSLPLWRIPSIVQHAAWGTMFLVSAWVIVANLLILELMYPKDKKPNQQVVWRLTVTFICLLMLSTARFAMAPSGITKTFTLGQPGVNMAFSPPDVERRLLLDATPELIGAAVLQKSDLLILPEGYAGHNEGDPIFTPLGERPLVPVIMGGNHVEGETTFQTAFLWNGEKWSYADKTRLVVFGEFVPFRGLPFLKNFDLPAGDLSPAKDFKTLDAGSYKIGQLICFEGVFPDLAVKHSMNGAQVLVQMSIDDWYENTPCHDQLWMSSVWRSIESGLPLVRVGARGQSLATDSRGALVTMLPIGERVAGEAKLVVPEKSDAFAYRMGFVYLCWLMCGVVGALTIFKKPIEKSTKVE